MKHEAFLKNFMYPSHLIDKVINWSISGKLVPGGVDISLNEDRSNTFYLIGNYSSFTQKPLTLLTKRYCNIIIVHLK